MYVKKIRAFPLKRKKKKENNAIVQYTCTSKRNYELLRAVILLEPFIFPL